MGKEAKDLAKDLTFVGVLVGGLVAVLPWGVCLFSKYLDFVIQVTK